MYTETQRRGKNEHIENGEKLCADIICRIHLIHTQGTPLITMIHFVRVPFSDTIIHP